MNRAQRDLDSELPRLLAWAYRGEVAGESLFGALAHAFADRGRPEKMRVLSDLERKMAGALTPLLDEYEVDEGDDERSRARGRENAEEVSGQSWSSFLAQFTAVTEAALERYHHLRELAPDPDRPVLAALVAHEQALQAFAVTELSGDEVHGLDQVRQVLGRI